MTDNRRRTRRVLLAAALVVAAAVPTSLGLARHDTAEARDPLSFRIATFNVLGNVHTQPYAHDDNFAPTRIRAEWTADLLRQLGSPDVIGTQESDAGQLADILRATGGRYDAWPGTAVPGGVEQSLLWRTDIWKATQKDTITIPFIRYQRAQPVVKLQNIQTGRSIWVMNVHNAPRDYQKQRNQALKIEIAKIKELRETGLPVFLVGDFNEKASAFCTVVGKTDLKTPMGGSATKDSCDPPSRLMRIDWIFGSSDVGFDEFVMDRSPLKRWVNDHLVPVASVTIP
jgi:endonuclease/exonuclease/phosphatase family metal-dependent hydrolase